MKKSITMRQMSALYMAIKNMGEGGVSIRGLGMCDLAMNKAKIEPAILEYEKMHRLPDRIREFNRVLSVCKNDQREMIYDEYKKDIEDFERKKIGIEDANDQPREIDLIMIKKSDLIIDEKNGKAAEVIFGLLPCIEGIEQGL